MAETEDNRRVPVECVTCGSVYAAKELADSNFQPIGAETCECGSTEFDIIDDPLGTDSDAG